MVGILYIFGNENTAFIINTLEWTIFCCIHILRIKAKYILFKDVGYRMSFTSETNSINSMFYEDDKCAYSIQF